MIRGGQVSGHLTFTAATEDVCCRGDRPQLSTKTVPSFFLLLSQKGIFMFAQIHLIAGIQNIVIRSR